MFSRPTAGGGGFGDPLERDPAHVMEDVADDYVSIERAAKDYGVVLKVIDAEILRLRDRPGRDRSATRAAIRAERRRLARDRSRRGGGQISRRRDRRARRGAPLRRDPRLGQRRAVAQHRPASSARCSTNAPPPIGTRAAPPKDRSGRAPPWRRRKPDFPR